MQRNKRLSSGTEQKINLNTGTIAILAGVLILGVGIGSAITSTTDGGQGNIASQQQLDMASVDNGGQALLLLMLKCIQPLIPQQALLHNQRCNLVA